MRDRFGRQCEAVHPLEKLECSLEENKLIMEALIEQLEKLEDSSRIKTS